MSAAVNEPADAEIETAVAAFVAVSDQFELFRQQVANFFLVSREFQQQPLPLVHSVKSRAKDLDHLRDKIKRKWIDGPITADNVFTRITDLVGVRVFHLYSRQFADIHRLIQRHVDETYWSFLEPPVAYSWDPEASAFFQGLGLRAVLRDSYYTSIHYIVKPQPSANITCEIQVRTLFEEIWGEIDHALNYPQATESVACREQLRVLAKLASTGTRLADAIFAVVEDERARGVVART